MDPCVLCDSKDCIVVFPLTNVITCLPTSGGGSVVDYILKKACDLSMVNAFNIGPLFLNLDHKPLYFDLTVSHSINKYSQMKEERRYIT